MPIDYIVAYDFLGDITFSKRLGFIEAGKDVGNMIKSAEQVMGYFSVVRNPAPFPIPFPIKPNLTNDPIRSVRSPNSRIS
jgi:hypothetical protein